MIFNMAAVRHFGFLKFALVISTQCSIKRIQYLNQPDVLKR